MDGNTSNSIGGVFGRRGFFRAGRQDTLSSVPFSDISWRERLSALMAPANSSVIRLPTPKR